MDPLVSRFKSFVDGLVTVEKRQIVALTEIAKDIVSTNPSLASQAAQVVTDKALKASADIQLPILYLLDSISKNVGEPYLSCFSAQLAKVFSHAWIVGAPGLHKSLRKLAGTWIAVFPPHVMKDVEVSMAHAGTIQSADSRKPMTRDPRLASDGSDANDILNLLANAGNISELLGVQIPANSLKSGEVSSSMELKSEMIREKNQAAVTRLLNATRANQSIFLDNKFLKRKVRDAKTQRSQMWYVDLDTWYKGTTGVQDLDDDTVDGKKRSSEPSVEVPSMSVPADEHQTECAVSGEKFEKYWDDTLQEWRYLDACKVMGAIAKKLGVPDGSLVCTSTIDFSSMPLTDQIAMGLSGPKNVSHGAKRMKVEPK